MEALAGLVFIGLVVVLAVFTVLADFKARPLSPLQSDHVPPRHETAAALPAAPLTAFNVNEFFLAGVRSRSCYAALRTTHGVITTLGIVSVAVLWGMMMYAAMGSMDRIYTSVVCALIAAALFIEYGFFRMIVDAVDVLIDTSRHKAEGNA